ncbi:hypothetical protein ACFYZ3_38415 [Streptomyces sp. NPDC001599]|uniref:AbiTii domain-containing protein n=1 Tax=Streptomyces sp. NPDC001599 TaxID=3364591 RepID=UPI0036B77CF2
MEDQMTERSSTLLAEIEQDALDDKAPLASTLRKCIVLGGKANSVELRQWATREARGYSRGDELPDYRTVGAPLHIDAVAGYNQIKGQQISPRSLPEGVRDDVRELYDVRVGVGEIEAMIDAAEGTHVHLGLPMAMDVAAMMNQANGDPYQQITRIYWSVSTTSLRAILDQVRTTLTELVGELRAAMPDEQEEPTPEQVGQAVTVALHDSPNATVHLNTAQSQGQGTSSAQPTPSAGEDEEESFWVRNKKAAFITGTVTVAAGLATVARLFWG